MLPFPTIKHSLSFGERRIEIEAVADVSSLLNEIVSRPNHDLYIKDERLPYWAEVWPSAIGLARYVANHAEDFREKEILEIGCGLGLPGIVAGMFSDTVTLTDYLEEAVEYTNHNWRLNYSSIPNSRMLDWRNPSANDKAEIILASDVAYESRMFKPLMEAIPKLLKENGVAYISEPNRGYARTFFNELKEKFAVETNEMTVDWNKMNNTVRVHKLKIR